MSFPYAAYGLGAPTVRPAIPGGLPQTVADVLDVGLADDPDAEALVGRHRRYTFAQLDCEANRAAHALAALGIGRATRVAYCGANHTDIVVAFLGTMRLGAIWVGIPRILAPPEKSYVLNDSEAEIVLAEGDAFAEIAALRPELVHAREIIEVRPGDPACPWRARLERASNERPRVEIDPFEPAAIAYTSGTTGFPKGAVHSQHNLLVPGAMAVLTRAYPQRQRHGVLLPLTILNLMVLVPVLVWQLGGCCVCMDRIDAVGVADWVRRERIEHFAAVPTVYHDLLTHPQVRPQDLTSLVRPEVGGAECPEEIRRLYRERFGAEVTIGYGMTEAPTAVTRSDGRAAPAPGLCGKALPHVRIVVVDEDDRPLAPGQIGEICVGPAEQGPLAGVYTPMLGYWRRPDATAEALRGGLYHSGDMGFLDDDGNLFIRGRRNELILRGGANVYPAEVERVLAADPTVAACAVLAKSDARLGERVVAAVVPAEGARVDPDALAKRCREHLARYKVPEEFFVVDSLPRNAMGKVVKRHLAAQLGFGAPSGADEGEQP